MASKSIAAKADRFIIDAVEILVIILGLSLITHCQESPAPPIVLVMQRANGPVVKGYNPHKLDYLFSEIMASVVSEGCNCVDAKSAKKIVFSEVWLVFKDLPPGWAAREEVDRRLNKDGHVFVKWIVFIPDLKWSEYSDKKENSDEYYFAYALAEIMATDAYPDLPAKQIAKAAHRAVIQTNARRWESER